MLLRYGHERQNVKRIKEKKVLRKQAKYHEEECIRMKKKKQLKTE